MAKTTSDCRHLTSVKPGPGCGKYVAGREDDPCSKQHAVPHGPEWAGDLAVRSTRIGSRRCQSQCGSGSIPDNVPHCSGCHTVLLARRAQDQAQLRSQSPRRLHITGYQLARSPHAGGHGSQALQMMYQRIWPQSPCLEGIVEKSAARMFIRRNRHDEEREGPSSCICPVLGRGKALKSRSDCDGGQTVPRAHWHTVPREGTPAEQRERHRRTNSQPRQTMSLAST